MDDESAKRAIATMERVRGSKWKAFGFCSLGLVVGMFLYFNPYEKDLMPLVQERTVFVKGMALVISMICGPLTLFFLVSLPTKVWERVCDWQIKKIREAVGKGNDGGSNLG
jgi:hypothetical protein